MKRARKKTTKNKAVISADAKLKNVTDTLPYTLGDQVTFDHLMSAYNSVVRSETYHYVERLNEILDSKYVMSPWEQEQFEKMLETYSLKYKSPLSKALK